MAGVRTSPLPSPPEMADNAASAQVGVAPARLVGLAGSNPTPLGRNTTSSAIKGIWGDGSLGRGFDTDSRSNKPSIKTSTGSGLLLHDSISDSWSAGAATLSNKGLGTVARPEVTCAPANRSQGLVDVPVPMPNGTPAARPPAINLNGVNGHQTRPNFGANFTNPSSFGSYEQPPAVYTKSDRPQAPLVSQPFENGQRFEATSGKHGSAQPSPSEERRSWISPSGLLAHQSVPGSRNSSLPPSRDGEEQHQMNGSVGRVNSESFRRQSTPHANPLLANAADSVNRTAVQFGQMSVNDTRVHDSSASDAASLSQYSRRGSRQVDSSPALTMSSIHPPHVQNGTLGTDQAQLNLNRARYEGVPFGESRPVSYSGGSHDSRRDSAQSRDFSASGGYGPLNMTAWGHVDQRLRAYHDMQALNDPRFTQMAFQPFRHHGAPYSANSHASSHVNSLMPYFPHGAIINYNQAMPRDNHEGVPYRSPVLETFKIYNKSNRKFDLRDAFGHVVEFSGDQHGSRFIQGKLEGATSEEKNIIFKEIMSNSVQLMTDIFGNYVIQKLFEHGDQYQKRALAMQMKGRVLALSVQMYGCRVVQKALEYVLTDQQAMIVSELQNDVLRCVRDQNGNHVIQKAIERCPPEAIRFIFDAFRGQTYSLSIHAYGCRVIQRCLEFCEESDKDVIMAELHEHMTSLVTDQYGNYVVQHVVQHGKDRDRKIVLSIVSDGLDIFSKHKFASNVVETCLAYGGADFRRLVLDRFIAGNKRAHESLLLGLIKDNFGNYVIRKSFIVRSAQTVIPADKHLAEKMLDVLPQPEYFLFLTHLGPEIQKARRAGCGKQVASVSRKCSGRAARAVADGRARSRRRRADLAMKASRLLISCVPIIRAEPSR
ncbi:hypothetical protein ANO11243_040830 [Dothideomycetidae sp. 11243]|nr:hypothetical protein ANO11243_040830 [fungal sp. No.11243]